MCGIFALLSSRRVASPPGDDLFHHIDSLLHAADPGALPCSLSEAAGVERLIEALEAARASAGKWTGRAAFLRVLEDAALRHRLESLAGRLGSWVRALEAVVASGPSTLQTERETLHRLIVGGKDIAWQIEKDVLGKAGPVLELVGEAGSVEASVLARAWELNLALSSLDRLEVRGRDSAGLAVFARFGDPERLDDFLDRSTSASGIRRSELERRRNPRLVHESVIRPSSAPGTLLFSFKVASEVGKMGENVAFLRRSIATDAFFQDVLRHPGAEIQSLAHTRWASNGIISQANCHPVDSTLLLDSRPCPEGQGDLVAVLNGDIDNYRELVERYVHGRSLAIDPLITTDAKIVPVVVAHHLREHGSLELAFQAAFREFEGSMAIGLMAADRPGEFLFAQKGSGQGLFFGLGDESVAVASEMYGVVELTSRYIKAEGERSTAGEVFRLRSTDHAVELEVLAGGRTAPVPESREEQAEITTRDINREGFPHFFLKEITESVASVEKTLRGKFELSGGGEIRCRLGADSVPVALVAGLREGRVRRIAVIGQGTAAVAARGVAHLLSVALARAPHPITVRAESAAELSAHELRDDMADTLVVAVSQSGTTTDTNRTVDLARQRGAWILGIVNRRNSDLVYKSHSVLYTSDGRDIEMSVASTKAFYAQNVAGQILALSLASALGTMAPEELRAAVEELHLLPDAMRSVLERGPQIAEIARECALSRRHWAVVGSGPAKIAADEVRIKLSELCYKSIAVDFLEDKKHIDLSSEPLVIVCAAGIGADLVPDAAKEVSILKAHNALPIVICEEGEHRFHPYAAGVIEVPACSGDLAYLPATVAGHLFGYHAAAAMDALADRLRSLRGRLVSLQESAGTGDGSAREVLDRLSASDTRSLVELEQMLEDGMLDAALPAGRAAGLSRVLQVSLGRISADAFCGGARCAARGVLDTVLASLSGAISELSRPIDAIKHQAKTVTVGISRTEARRDHGVVWTALEELAIAELDLLESHRAFLRAFEPLVAAVEGATSYRVRGLDALGRPSEETTVVVERKLGSARSITSRCEVEQPLTGNKWAVVKLRDIFLGRGQRDGRKIMILPCVGESAEGRLVLLHVALAENGDREARLRALAARERVFDRLKGAVTECGLDWDPSLIDAVDNELLFLEPPEKVAEELAQSPVGRALTPRG